MSLLCTSTFTSGALVSKIGPAVLSFLYPAGLAKGARRESRRSKSSTISHPSVVLQNKVEEWFINSLVLAGHCRNHNPVLPRTRSFAICRPKAIAGRQQTYRSVSGRRFAHTNAAVSHGPENNTTREELIALVDQYEGMSMTDQLPILELPNLHQPSDGPHLTISNKVEEDWPPPGHTWPANVETKALVKELEAALKDFETDPEHVYNVYKKLPAPRAPYLESKTRHMLLRHLSIVERKDEDSMLRYFSVIDDMKSTAIPLTVHEWTSAMSFAARYVTRSTETEVEAALHIWREMEHVVGVKANHATFNVLYDVACKAGKFNLAEMIYTEMAARGLEFNRYHHVSLITFYGLKGDGFAVRAAYKNLVEANEIVDTTVINSLISSLLKCNEDQAALAVYERTKKMHTARGGMASAPPTFKSKRKITATLLNMAEMAKKNPELKAQAEQSASIAPDVQTYRILINHFSVQLGDLHRTTQFLDEMRFFDLPLHGAMFLALLKGFTIHGGVRYSHWTEKRLESVWAAFLQAIEQNGEGHGAELYISRWMAIWAVRAFAKCSGKSKMIEVWEDLRERWNPGQADLDFVLGLMRPLLEGEDVARKKDDWLVGFR